MSEEYGPETLILIFFKYFIAGIISFFSLFSLSKLSQCGFNPVTAILGFIFKTFYKNYLFFLFYNYIFFFNIFSNF